MIWINANIKDHMHLASFKVHQVDSVFQSFRAGEKGYYVTNLPFF